MIKNRLKQFMLTDSSDHYSKIFKEIVHTKEEKRTVQS